MERTKGLIIKQSDYGEGNRMLTVFTEDFGIIKAAAYGVKGAKGRRSAASQFLSWADFMLYFGRGDVATVNSVTSIESFFPIQEDLEKLALSSYLADITYYAQEMNLPNPPLLRLLLNTLYACAYNNVPILKAKAVYELRLAADMGYMPIVAACSACRERKEPRYFSNECGGVICRDCHSSLRDDIPISKEAYAAMGYILYAEDRKIFSFDISEKALVEVGKISESYILYRLERDFASLDYLKKLLAQQ